jgi:hypothetical protein
MRSCKGPTLDSRVSGADLGAGGATEAVPFRHYQDDCYEVTHARSRIHKVRLFICPTAVQVAGRAPRKSASLKEVSLRLSSSLPTRPRTVS